MSITCCFAVRSKAMQPAKRTKRRADDGTANWHRGAAETGDQKSAVTLISMADLFPVSHTGFKSEKGKRFGLFLVKMLTGRCG